MYLTGESLPRRRARYENELPLAKLSENFSRYLVESLSQFGSVQQELNDGLDARRRLGYLYERVQEKRRDPEGSRGPFGILCDLLEDVPDGELGAAGDGSAPRRSGGAV